MEQAKLENLYQTENGIVLPQTDDMVSNVRDDLVSVFGNGMRFDTKTPAGRILEYLARSFRSVLAVNAQNANQQNIYTATGRYLDGHGTIYNLPRRGANTTRVLVSFVGENDLYIPSNFQAEDDAGNRFVMRDAVKLDGTGRAVGWMYATDENQRIEVKANTLTAPVTVIDGLESIINESDGIAGYAEESDEEYRARLVKSLNTGIDFVSSITNRLYQVDDVTGCVVYENGDSVDRVVDHTLVSAHSIFVCVQGGSDAEVAEAIYRSKPAGCGYTSTPYESNLGGVDNVKVFATVVKRRDESNPSSSVAYPVIFYRPYEFDPEIVVRVGKNLYTGDDIVRDVRKSVMDFVNGLGVGRGCTDIDIGSAVMRTIPSVWVRGVSICGSKAFNAYGYVTLAVTEHNITVEVE